METGSIELVLKELPLLTIGPMPQCLQTLELGLVEWAEEGTCFVISAEINAVALNIESS